MNKIDFKSGEVIYNEFEIDFTKKFSEQENCLLEDLLQVKYAQNYLLDVGWYPEFESKGAFVVQVIKNQNWEEPVYKKASQNKEDLILSLNSAISIAESKI